MARGETTRRSFLSPSKARRTMMVMNMFWLVFEGQVLYQRALVLLGAGELGAFELPGAINGLHLARADFRLCESLR